MKFTNFSVEAILHPSFGIRTDYKNCFIKGEECSSDAFPAISSNSVVKVESLEERLTSRPCAEGDSCGTNHQVTEKSRDTAETSSPGPFPAWVYCTRYSDRPSAGPRSRRPCRKARRGEHRQRTSFSRPQIEGLTAAFRDNPYLTETSKHSLATDLSLEVSQIKIWFQNKRAKSKKTSTQKSTLAINLAQQGLYNHGSHNSWSRMELSR